MPLVELPLNSGIDESTDRILLPQAKLRIANNCRLDRDGRIGVRPAYTALGTTTYSTGALVAYDVVNFNGRLCALGDQTGQSRPTDLFEFVSGAGAWRATAGPDTNVASAPRIPRATAVREVGRIPDLSGDATEVWVAAGGGLVCAVTQLSDGTARVHVLNPATDQTVFLSTLTLTFGKCLFDGTKFWVIGLGSANIEGRTFNPASDKSLSGATSLVAAPGALTDLAVAQTGATDFTIAYIVSSALTTLKVNRFNSSGTSQAAYNVAPGFTSLQACAVAGNVAGTRIVVFVQDNGAFKVCSNTASGATLVGPTSVFSGATVTAWSHISLTYSGGGTTYLLCGVIDAVTATEDTATQLLTSDTANTLGSTTKYFDGFLDAAPAPLTGGGQLNWYFGAHDTMAGGTGGTSYGTNALIEQGNNLPQCFKDNQLTTVPTVGNHMSNVAMLGTKLYWGNITRGVLDTRDSTGGPGAGQGQITEIEMGDTGRRSMVVLGNQLHIAGALPLVYDGRYLTEHGFAERPVITLAPTTGGSKTLLGTYYVQTVWEVVDGKGQILRSIPSPVVGPLTLTGVNNAITVLSSTPHSLRRHPYWAAQGGFSVRVGFYVTQSGGANLQIEKYVTVGTATFAQPISTTLTAADTALAANLVVYVQSQTPIPHAAPPPYQYSWRQRERFAVAGGPQPEKITHSKLLFPSEPVEFAPLGRIGFASRANQDVTALAAMDTTTVVFTAQEIGLITGRGPEQDGTGDFDALRTLNAPGGCSNWRSVVGMPEGVMFQMAADKLMLLAQDGSIVWKGQPVRDTLAAYPTVAGAVHVRSQMIVAFACNNLAGNDGIIIVYDLRKDTWFIDTIGAAIASVSEYQGRLVYISGGVVFLQDASVGLGAAALPTMQIDFGSLAPFSPLGNGDVPVIAALLTFVGDCTIQGKISTDDGQNFADMGSFTLGSGNAQIANPSSGAALTSGDPVSLHWRPNVQSLERLAVRFIVTAATNSGGVRFHVVELDVRGTGKLNPQPASQTA